MERESRGTRSRRARPSARRKPTSARARPPPQFEQKEENGENEERETSSLVAGDRGRKDPFVLERPRKRRGIPRDGQTCDTRPGAPFFVAGRIFHSTSRIVVESPKQSSSTKGTVILACAFRLILLTERAGKLYLRCCYFINNGTWTISQINGRRRSTRLTLRHRYKSIKKQILHCSSLYRSLSRDVIRDVISTV